MTSPGLDGELEGHRFRKMWLIELPVRSSPGELQLQEGEKSFPGWWKYPPVEEECLPVRFRHPPVSFFMPGVVPFPGRLSRSASTFF